MVGRTLAVRVRRLIALLSVKAPHKDRRHPNSTHNLPPPPDNLAAAPRHNIETMAEQEEDYSSLPLTDRFVHKV